MDHKPFEGHLVLKDFTKRQSSQLFRCSVAATCTCIYGYTPIHMYVSTCLSLCFGVLLIWFGVGARAIVVGLGSLSFFCDTRWRIFRDVCTYTYTRIPAYTCVHMCVYVHIHIDICIYMQKCIHYVCTHFFSRVHVFVRERVFKLFRRSMTIICILAFLASGCIGIVRLPYFGHWYFHSHESR